MNSTQLTINFQTACATRLPLWRKHRKNALYRRTEDFVQWLLFDTSRFNVAAAPHYSVQTLASQFPTAALTLGNRIRDERGADLWVIPEDWKARKDEIVERILQQIDPSALKPLATESIVDFLNRFQSNHESAITARGVAAIASGNIDEGYHSLRQAIEKYKSVPYPWARVEEARLNGWLSYAPEDILSVLRQQAEVGAQLLKLK